MKRFKVYMSVKEDKHVTITVDAKNDMQAKQKAVTGDYKPAQRESEIIGLEINAYHAEEIKTKKKG